VPADSGGLLLVHAHPDDEAAGTGGTIARCVAEGRRVDLVTCTGGEEGEIHDPELDVAEALPRLKEIRLAELACSIEALGRGAVRLHLLGYRDSGMMGSEANERPDSFWRVDLEEATARLVAIVREARPSVIVSYDANGMYGHPDHISAHRIASGAWEAAADPSRYPDAGSPHEVAKLYEVAFSREGWLSLETEMRSRGIALPWEADEAAQGEALGENALGEEPEPFGTPEAEITSRVRVGRWLERKRRSLDCHRTQRQDMGWILDLPDDLYRRAMGTEQYVLRRWRGREVPSRYRESDLFAGLPR
jgi:N-acetyl-1-D-myo-inositol-2-amino-2-deoxy-alpha-D-glucopyranoside deacetylase